MTAAAKILMLQKKAPDIIIETRHNGHKLMITHIKDDVLGIDEHYNTESQSQAKAHSMLSFIVMQIPER